MFTARVRIRARSRSKPHPFILVSEDGQTFKSLLEAVPFRVQPGDTGAATFDMFGNVIKFQIDAIDADW